MTTASLMNYNGDLYLTDRIKEVNKANYKLIAEIHLNAGEGTGTETYYYHGSPTGKKVADQISKEISSALGIKQRSNGVDDGGDKVKLNKNGKDYFAVIRDTKPTAVLVETVFIDTESDLTKVKTADGQAKCGVAVAKGIAKALNLELISDKKEPEEKKLFRVCVGTYAVKSNADAMKAGLEKLGFDAYIVEV
jgi:N-acetylmuramoyl-L-alanine amidase